MKLVRKLRQVVKSATHKPPQTLPDLTASWQNRDIPERQAQIADAQLAELQKGCAPAVFTVAAELLKMIPAQSGVKLLDIACGYGYYNEVISRLVPQLHVEYLGGDFNEAMIKLAKRRYPGTNFQFEDIRSLSLPDRSFDIVFSSATIMHLRDYKEGLRELARVSKNWLVLHRMGIIWKKKSFVDVQHAYNTDFYAHAINHDEFVAELSRLGFRVVVEKEISKRSWLAPQDLSLLAQRH